MNVLALHGAGGNAQTWRNAGSIRISSPDNPHPSDETRALTLQPLDLPGRGATEGPACTDVDALSEWLVAKLRHFDTPPVVLGHSLGGAIGLMAALNLPDLIRGLVMVSSSARLRVGDAFLASVERAAGEGASLDWSIAFADSGAVVDAYAELASSTPAVSMLADWRACDRFDVRQRVSSLTVPTLVVYGALDRLTPPKHQHWLANAISGSALVELSGVGHMVPWEAPERLWSTVQEWLCERGLDG